MSRDRLAFCLVSTFYPPDHFGGDAVCVQQLARALVRRGHTVHVVHNRDAYRVLGGEPSPKEQDEDDGVQVHALSTRRPLAATLAVHQTGTPAFYRAALRRIFEARDFDVIHYHNISLMGGPGVLAMGRGLKLLTLHDYWLVCPTHALWKLNRQVCDVRACLRCQLTYRRPPQLWRRGTAMEEGLRHVDCLLAPSAFAAERHRAGGVEHPIAVLPNFLPNDRPAGIHFNANSAEASSGTIESDRERTGERPRFLAIGRLEKLKGMQEAIAAFRRLPDCDLLIAGVGDYERELRREARDAPNVRFLGRVAAPELRPLIRGAAAVVVPSLCEETFGLVVIEAFREGTPVLARNRGALAELLAQSGGGLVFHDVAELERQAVRIAEDEALRSRLGRQGAQAFRERWTEDVVLDEYLQLVERLLSRADAGGLAAAGVRAV